MWRFCCLIVLLPLFAFEHNNSDLYSVRLNPTRIDADKVFLLIDKSDYRMYVYEDVTLIKIYKVVFGSNDQSDKRVEGDKRTPNGTFRISQKRMDNRWSRFMLLDYPNHESLEKHERRVARGEVSSGASMGGGIGIHGVEYGSGIRDFYVDRRINWTLGCVSLKNGDVNEIYNVVKVGTPVVIRQ
ncbi:L,D-transpeptidase [Chitinophaga sp.]|uniref:L,D-transpeptidase family protein n=1 Tax=Chitinophaga sp. TaxID=1869181 RepID=UPI002611BB5B|nr:L,D-transpeptidase [uncultured Chitinophaga sp.]